MHIIELTAENVKRIKAVQIRPDGAVQVVSGRNAQGKSSVLDTIWMVLEWRAASKKTPRPIRDGEDVARATLDLGDYTVTRTWDAKKGTTALTVETPDGTPQPRQQELLDSLLGDLSFDPLAFSQQKGPEQVQTLLGLVPLPFDLAKMDAQRQSMYDKRHAVGQDRTRAKGAMDSMATPDPDLPSESVSTQGILAEYQAVQDEINAHNQKRLDLASAQADASIQAKEVQRLKDALAEATAMLASRTEAVAAAQDAVDALPDDPDLGPIKERLNAAEDLNTAVRDAQGFYTKKSEWAALDDEWRELDEAMAHLDKTKADGLAAATFPIDGLGFDDDGVTYLGVPFSQASQAEQLRVSLALAMAMNPTLRVIRITDGSLLDADNMALIEQMAADHDFQVWIERVEGTAGVIIEDGRVV